MFDLRTSRNRNHKILVTYWLATWQNQSRDGFSGYGSFWFINRIRPLTVGFFPVLCSREQGTFAKLQHSPVEVFYAVDLVRGVHGEGNAVQRFAAHHADEAAGMVRFSSRSQHLQGSQTVRFEWLKIRKLEWTQYKGPTMHTLRIKSSVCFFVVFEKKGAKKMISLD